MLETEVYYAKKGHNQVIAYRNKQNLPIFINIGNGDYAPRIDNIIIPNQSYIIEKVIKNLYQYEIYKKCTQKVGVKLEHIWKPLLDQNIQDELDFNEYEKCAAKRDLGILVQMLQDALMYIEPTEDGLKCCGHKLRELLILSCSNVESKFKQYQFGDNERTRDYIKLLDYVDLSKYKLSLVGYINKHKSVPFFDWKKSSPTQSLPWFDAYTKIKHGQQDSMCLATLENCIDAVAANIIMYVIRYSPYTLYRETDVCSNLVSSFLGIGIEKTEDIYLPEINAEKEISGAFFHPIRFSNGETITNDYLPRIEPFETEKLSK